MTARKIDHLVLPVGTLVQARGRLSALGFTVAPDGHHPFGTANACIFLDDGTYLEPLALEDRRRAGLAAKRGNIFVERDMAFRGRKGRQGLSAIVVASDDASADHQRFVESGISAGEPLEFARIMTSPEGDEREGRFRLAFAASEGASDFFAFACQRVVSFPQDMGGLRVHMNAVIGVKEIVMSDEAPLQSAPLLQNLLSSEPENVDSGLVFAGQNARVRVVDGGQLQQEFGTAASAFATGLSGQAVIFRTGDLAVTEITLAANDVAFIRRDGRVLVSPAPGQGVFFGFEE